VLWPHYPSKNVFSDHQNRLYGKSACLRCGGKLFHSPGPATAKALSQKVLWVRVTTHVRLSVERIVVAHERRRQDDSHQLSMTQYFRTATGEQVWQPWNRCYNNITGQCGAVIMAQPLRDFTRFTWWMQNGVGWLPTFEPSQIALGRWFA